MEVISNLLKDVTIPNFVKVRQLFDSDHIEEPEMELCHQLQQLEEILEIQPGMKIAIAIGSRGITNLAAFTKIVVDAVKERGAFPFIVPAMGSHGGATAQGQIQVLNNLGIDENTVGAPIHSTMEVVLLGELPNGLPIFFDKNAYHSDGIIIINRVKPHTGFSGPVESGIMKMIAVGLGNHKGAEACHQLGFPLLSKRILTMARIILKAAPIRFGVALVENAYDQTCKIELLPANQIESKEIELLKLARTKIANLMFERCDVLITDYIGKNISGAGIDTNAIGRAQKVNKLVALDLTKESNGNATGIGIADFTTQRLVDQVDWTVTYANGITSTSIQAVKMAVTLSNDLDAIRAAIKTSNVIDFQKCKMIRIHDTKHLQDIEISSSLLQEALEHNNIEVISDPYDLEFDGEGFLVKTSSLALNATENFFEN